MLMKVGIAFQNFQLPLQLNMHVYEALARQEYLSLRLSSEARNCSRYFTREWQGQKVGPALTSMAMNEANSLTSLYFFHEKLDNLIS